MNRVISLLLVASFALFAGSPILADMILSSSGTATDAVPDASARGAEIAAQPDGATAVDAETLAYFQSNPDQVQRTGNIGIIGIFALAVLLGSVYFFGATDTPHPGW